MKIAIIISILLAMTLSSFAEAQLTKEDVRQIIKEENFQQEERLKQYISAENAKMEARLKQYIDAEIAKMKVELKDEIGKNLTGIAVVTEGLEFLKWIMGFLALLVIGATAMPSILQAWRERKGTKEIQQLAEVVDTLRKEIALLKEQRIIKP